MASIPGLHKGLKIPAGGTVRKPYSSSVPSPHRLLKNSSSGKVLENTQNRIKYLSNIELGPCRNIYRTLHKKQIEYMYIYFCDSSLLSRFKNRFIFSFKNNNIRDLATGFGLVKYRQVKAMKMLSSLHNCQHNLITAALI